MTRVGERAEQTEKFRFRISASVAGADSSDHQGIDFSISSSASLKKDKRIKEDKDREDLSQAR